MRKKIDRPTSGFSGLRTREGMRRTLPFHPPPLADPASDPGELTIGDLYAEHWRYVLALLPSYRIWTQDAEDVAQTVWMHVHRRRGSYDPQKHATRRAWITGFVDRCATNHRRTQKRRGLIPIEDPGALLLAPDLDPEQAAILRDLHRLIPNDDQRVALLLQVLHGLSIAEIAAVQEVTESAVEWRLSMARKNLEDGDEKKRGGAFLGFGSLEALAEALKPKPIPDEVGEAQWKRIAERIRQEEASPSHEDAPNSSEDAAPGDTEPPPSSSPPAAALPAMTSPAGPAVATLGTAKLAGLVALALVLGSGGLLARGTARHEQAMATTDAGSVSSAAPSTVAPAACASSATTATSTRPASGAAPSTSTRPTASSVAASTSTTPASSAAPVAVAPATSSEQESLHVLAQMRDAMIGRRFSAVLALAEQHARRFGVTHIRAREALRIEALRQTGRPDAAEQHARAVVMAHPEHRRALERAAGRALP